MKKTVLKVFVGALFISSIILNVFISNNRNSSNITLKDIITTQIAEAEINPECPNGCKCGCGGCYCYEYYDYLKEASWPN